jgi:uncharacterized protein (TIGR02246 family)
MPYATRHDGPMEEAEIKNLYDDVIGGWNDHDGTAMAAPFADDGVVIGFDGSVHSGKETIAEEMARIFADHETGRYVVKVRGVRPLGSDAAILRAITGLIPPGQTQIKAETNAHQTLVAERRDGRWRVVLFQNTPAQFHGRPHLVDEMTRELQAIADT